MMTSTYLTALVLMTGLGYVASADNVVEVYFVVEPKVIQNYQSVGYSQAEALTTLNNDIQFYLDQVNQFFSSMSEHGLSIQIRQKDLKVLDMTEEMFPDCLLLKGKDLQADMALAVFKDWLERTDAKNLIGYDMALVWTGFDIFGSSGSSVTGYAATKAVCTDHAVAAVEFDMTQNTAITTAHEIAHSLGSPHDQTLACPTHHGYIMAPASSVNNENRWQFSSCSVNGITEYLETLSSNCLLETTISASTFEQSSQSNSDILDVEKVCQRARMDTQSYFCAYTNVYNYQPVKGDVVCQKLYCGQKGSMSCCSAMPTDGMVCDANKRCHAGSCVTASFPTPPNLDSDCVFGDIKSDYIFGENLSCREYINMHGEISCYGSNFASMCCKTCKDERDPDFPNCPHGDRSTDCADYEDWQVCFGGNIDICCQKCRNYRRRRAITNSTQVVDLKPLPKEHFTPPLIVEDDDAKKTGIVAAD